MRSRQLKPGFFTNERLCALPFETRILFAGLWAIADRSGRLEDRPRRIHAEIFPYDLILNVDSMLETLERENFIFRYIINGCSYIQIPKWFKHQNPHPHEMSSVIPPIPVDLSDLIACRDFSRMSRDMSNHQPSVCPSGSSGSSCLQDLPLPVPATPQNGVAVTEAATQFSLSEPENGNRKRRTSKGKPLMSEPQAEAWGRMLGTFPNPGTQTASGRNLWRDEVKEPELWERLISDCKVERAAREHTRETRYMGGLHTWIEAKLLLYAAGVQAPTANEIPLSAGDRNNQLMHEKFARRMIADGLVRSK